MEIAKSMLIAASGMRAQSERMRIIAENVANANSTAEAPGGDPYRRRVATFETHLDRASGVEVVRAGRPVLDGSDFRLQYNPGHPAADDRGYVRLPNVNTLVEMMDMREAQRSYEANLNVVENARQMIARTIDLLRR